MDLRCIEKCFGRRHETEIPRWRGESLGETGGYSVSLCGHRVEDVVGVWLEGCWQQLAEGQTTVLEVAADELMTL